MWIDVSVSWNWRWQRPNSKRSVSLYFSHTRQKKNNQAKERPTESKWKMTNKWLQQSLHTHAHAHPNTLSDLEQKSANKRQKLVILHSELAAVSVFPACCSASFSSFLEIEIDYFYLCFYRSFVRVNQCKAENERAFSWSSTDAHTAIMRWWRQYYCYYSRCFIVTFISVHFRCIIYFSFTFGSSFFLRLFLFDFYSVIHLIDLVLFSFLIFL